MLVPWLLLFEITWSSYLEEKKCMLPFVLQILKLLPFSYSIGDKLLNIINNSLFWNSLPNKIITKVNLQKRNYLVMA
jgi:hypothetical protein